MKSLYLAIWYKCNQRCTGCPITNNINKDFSMTLDEIEKSLAEFARFIHEGEFVDVTISGGEPSLHPQFIEIVEAVLAKGFNCTILTNAERFSDVCFCDAFLERIDIRRVRIVTTIHSSCSEIHEMQNKTKGSFERSISALKYLSLRGMNVAIKHCITSKNVADTANFIEFIDKSFHPSVEMQLWGLDYCGLSKGDALELYMPFTQMRKYIEEALDRYLVIRSKNDRFLSLNNIPLCAIDPYYWGLVSDSANGDYSKYLDPTTALDCVSDDSGPLSPKCKECAVYENCPGTYSSMFKYFGDDTVIPVVSVDD